MNNTPFTNAAEREVRATLALATARAPDQPSAFLAALAVCDYIGSRLSITKYADAVARGEPIPTAGDDREIAELALANGSGLCGQAASIAIMLYARLGVPARQLDVLHDAGGHTTVEVRYGPNWHWFDPTFGYFYRKPSGVVLSLIGALQHPDPNSIRVGSEARLSVQLSRLADPVVYGLDLMTLTSYRVTYHNGKELYRR